MPDRFTEDEARQVFARAAERQHAADASPAGLSLAELQEVGAAAGLDPAHVAAAVAEVRGARPVAPPATFVGVDVEPRASRVLPGEVTDEVWEQMVARLRRTFGAKGTPTDVGRIREWSSGPNSNLLVTVEPDAAGARVALQTSKASEAAQYRALVGVLGAMAVLFSALGVATGNGGDAGFWVFISALVVAAVVFPLLGRQSYARWARRRQGEFDALLDGFELLVRDAAPPGAAPPDAAPRGALGAEAGGAGRLDVDALDAAPDSAAPPERRRTQA